MFIRTVIEATVNSILKEWRDSWPGGLEEQSYSKLNLIAHCRSGTLGYNRARCEDCGEGSWYASSCGDRHCPACLGPRQAKWSQSVCERLPDCPHFHVVFTVPEEVREFFASNYELATGLLFEASSRTLRSFQRNNWGVEGGHLAVLHTWGSTLCWHPHLHVLVSAGGRDVTTGRWRRARGDYMFPVRAMSRVFGAIMVRLIEELEGREGVVWPEGCGSAEQRRAWRIGLAGKGWNIYSRPTLGNTRAAVRYLARYTSRIAISNARVLRVDEHLRTVTIAWRDYRGGGHKREMVLGAREFIRRFASHLVPPGLRRVRYFGMLAPGKNRGFRHVPGAPPSPVAEVAAGDGRPECPHCGGSDWAYRHLYTKLDPTTPSKPTGGSFSLGCLHIARAGPKPPKKGVQQVDADGPPTAGRSIVA